MNIGALVNPCVFSDFPLEQGFFVSVVPQLVRRCREHCRIGILDIKLFGVGELLWPKKKKMMDVERGINGLPVSYLIEHIERIVDFREELPFWQF